MNDPTWNEDRLRERLRERGAAASACPPPETWIELLRGRLDEPAAERARQHLAECAACGEAAADARRFLAARRR